MGNYCKTGKKSTPTNKRLYNSIKTKIKKRSKVWPSAYASGQLVREYKSRGGKYNCSFGSLDRWFKEKWVNVCKPKGNGYESCGRKKSSWKNYPYCRPLKRINSSTPKTVREIGKSKIREMCKKKRKNPRKKHSLKFGNKNIIDNYNKSMNYGYNLGPSTSNLDSFYKNGTANSLNYDLPTRKCESANYGTVVTRFGNRKRNYSFGVRVTKEGINEKKELYRNFSIEALHEEREYNLERYNKMLRIPGLSSEDIENLRILYIDIIDQVIREKEDEPNKIKNTIKNLGKRESGLWRFGKKSKKSKKINKNYKNKSTLKTPLLLKDIKYLKQ
jgi:hypothetical protein